MPGDAEQQSFTVPPDSSVVTALEVGDDNLGHTVSTCLPSIFDGDLRSEVIRIRED